MGDLKQKSCKPCEGDMDILDRETAEAHLLELSDWVLHDDAKEISRTFKFKNYYQTIAFVNALAWIAHQEDHHPDIEVGYKTCRVRYSTHSIGGLSENDLICAAKLNDLIAG